MNPDDSYVTFGDIQDVLISSHEKNKASEKNIGFFDAVTYLYEHKQVRSGTPEKPDFLSWNRMDDQDLYTLAREIPIRISEVFDVITEFNIEYNSIYLTTSNPVQICLESYYAPQVLTMYDYFTVIYVLKGQCLLQLEGGNRRMNTGELCLMAPNTPNQVYVEPGNLVINIMSHAKHFQDHFFKITGKDNLLSAFFVKSLYRAQPSPLFFQIPPSTELRSIIAHLFNEFVSDEAYKTEVFNNYLRIFYAQILRSHTTTYTYYASERKTTPYTVIPAILNYIHTHYQELTLPALADFFHYDDAYLSKLIRNATGKTYSQILTDRKIDEAKRMLKNSTLSIDHIAEKVGYNSSDHFSHTFKKMTGVSPREYRKN